MPNKLRLLYTHAANSLSSIGKDLQAAGLSVFYFPTLAFAPPDDLIALQQAFATLEQQSRLIFISPQSVRAFWQQLEKQHQILAPSLQIAAIGPGTGQALLKAGWLQPICYPTTESSSEALFALPFFKAVAGEKMGIVRGEGGRQYIDEKLIESGAWVTPFIVYKRILPMVDPTACRERIQYHHFDATTAMSFESLNNLKILLGEAFFDQLKMTPLIVPSERIKKLAEDLGFQTIWVARKPSADAIIDLLKNI